MHLSPSQSRIDLMVRPTRFWVPVDMKFMKDVVGVQLGKGGCQSFHCLAMSVDCFGE